MFEPLVMFFRLTNSPVTFQTMMNDIFADLIAEGHVVIYLDDILIFTRTLEEHCQIVRRVLEKLHSHKLYLKPKKCEFEKESIEYLGLIISHNHIVMDPAKVAGVLEWPVPVNLKEVQFFVGFLNFYRRFIEGFAKVARPLHNLTKKGTPFKFGKEELAALAKLKELITSAPILMLPNSTQPFRIEADSSDFATGGVLSQLCSDDGKWHPVAFLSKSLSAVERNYKIHDKEMLAIIRALEEWRHFLEGAQHTIEIWTDHKNLEYFQTAQNLNRCQAHWSLYLSRFHFDLFHWPGTSMGKPNAVSHRVDHNDSRLDNQGRVLLSLDLFRVWALTVVRAEGEAKELLCEIQQSMRSTELEDPVAKAAALLWRGKQWGQLHRSEWDFKGEDLLLFNGRIYVPDATDLQQRIIAQHHDSLVAGHPRRWKTLKLISWSYQWLNMSHMIGNYTSTCNTCLRNKILPRKPLGELNPIIPPKDHWGHVSVDFIGELPAAHGFNAIMACIDSVSKRAHFIPTYTRVDAPGTATLYRDHVWKLHGLPDEVLTDRGPQFTSMMLKELYQMLSIKCALTTSYHPQSDGQ
jgi:hypothetical protein